MVCKILIIGAGLTGAVVGSILRKIYNKNIQITFWEANQTVGGRMRTSLSPDSNCKVDVGAQYITLSREKFMEYNKIYDSLISSKIIEPMQSKVEGLNESPKDIMQFIAPEGMTSLVQYFINEASCDIYLEHRVIQISKLEDNWFVETADGVKDSFDIVVLTIPVPQILKLTGSVQDIINKNLQINHNLKSVKYSSRYALSLFFNTNVKFNTLWDSKYINNDIFRFVSFDNQKQNRQDIPSAVIIHTSTQYGEKNANRNLFDVKEELINHMKELFPDWPEPIHTDCTWWLYSQVITPYKEQPGCITLSHNPLLIAGGDSFTASNVHNCISAAFAVVNFMQEEVRKKNT